jgi:hypothetical protein
MASGDLLASFHPLHNEAPATAAATLDVRNGHPVLDFDAAADESAVFTGIMPTNYAGGGIIVYVWATFTSDTTTGHVARIEGAFEFIQAGTLDIDADSFAAAQSGAVSVLTTSGILNTGSLTFTNAQIDGAESGHPFRFKFSRDADGTTGTDDATGDLEVLAIELQEI